MMRDERPVAPVTGAGYGLGTASAQRLAEQGSDVAVTELAHVDANATVNAIAHPGGRAAAIAQDVRDIDQIGSAIDGTLRAFGRLDVLVNNAGVPCSRPALEVEPTGFDEVQAINVRGASFMAQRAARHWVASGRPGNIVNVASTLPSSACPGSRSTPSRRPRWPA